MGADAVGIFVCALGPELDKAAPFHVCEPCIKEKTLWDLVSAQTLNLARQQAAQGNAAQQAEQAAQQAAAEKATDDEEALAKKRFEKIEALKQAKNTPGLNIVERTRREVEATYPKS